MDLSYVITVIVCGCIGVIIGNYRGRPGFGFFLGLFGPVGWIVILLLPKAGKAKEDEEKNDFYAKEEAKRLSKIKTAEDAYREQVTSKKWRVSKAGENLGELDFAAIKLIEKQSNGDLAEYAFFDGAKGEWTSLSGLPALNIAPPAPAPKRAPSGVRYDG